MPWCSGLLLVVVILIIWCAAGRPSICERVGRMMGRRQGMTNAETVNTLSKIGQVFDVEDDNVVPSPYVVDSSSNYDPVRMGAIKANELEAHKRGLQDMAPFAYTGPARPSSFLRDDDPYYRATGIKSVGGVVPRSLRKAVSGPQAGARQVTTTSEVDLRAVHVDAALAPTYDW
jgi:hypothetical protein